MSPTSVFAFTLLAAPLLPVAVRAETAPSAPAASIYRIAVSGTT